MRQPLVVETARGPVTMTDAIICNKCQVTLWKSSPSDHPPTPEYFEVEKKWGKHSKWNGETHVFHLCSGCYQYLLEDFEIPAAREK